MTFFWVKLSRAEVASSNIRTLGFGAIALAISSLCFCPPEIPPCPSEIMVCIPIGISRISGAIPAASAASQASSIVSRGAEIVMFSKILPIRSFPFCITTPICLRSDLRSRLLISLPS